MTSANVGVRGPDHLLSALPAAGPHLDVETLREIDAVLQVRQTAAIA